uniref:GGDEF domain-containing protein n=1 Tax=Altererythrobacter segetis TaxID=1104773 RepID=UPI001409696A|nr:GGDEF domain-containing protein [Altererythrobacter segetis]
MVLICTDAAAFLDLVTGPDLWFGPAYLLVICIAAWSLGWRAGQLIGVGCMVLTLALNGFNLYPYAAAAFAWNFGMRFVAISTVVAVMAGARRAYLREWWLARSDVLTGALNRQAFFELAPSAIDAGRWRLLVYADLDGLKKVNDVQGHASGDACLRAYGAAVRKMIRKNDIFARVGGDEFLIFMSVKDEAAAKTVALRLHKAMNRIKAEGDSLNCSVGGLVVPPGDACFDDLVRNADNLMYKAKLRGACLQLGIASHVQPTARGRARAKSRISSTWALGAHANAVDRRADTRSGVNEAAPS